MGLYRWLRGYSRDKTAFLVRPKMPHVDGRPLALLLPEPRLSPARGRGDDSLSVCGHFGKRSYRMLYCIACETRSSEFKGTPCSTSQRPNTRLRNSDAFGITPVAWPLVFASGRAS